MMRDYECAACGRKNSAAPGEPLAMRECGRGCDGVFCAGCLADHEAACSTVPASMPDATGCSLDFDEHLGG